MNAPIIAALAGVSSVLGFLSLLAYFYLVAQTHRAERSIRETIEGAGLFNAAQVLDILKQFKSDKARLEALVQLTSLDQNKANALLQKIKGNVDVRQLQRLTHRHQIIWAGLVGGFLLLLGIIGILISRGKGQLAEPAVPSPGGVSAFYKDSGQDGPSKPEASGGKTRVRTANTPPVRSALPNSPRLRVDLLIPSSMSDAEVWLDGQKARVIRRVATVITIEVPAGGRSHSFKIESRGRECVETVAVTEDRTMLTPCGG